MSANLDDNFIYNLRNEFLSDKSSLFDDFRESLFNLRDTWQSCFIDIKKNLHNIKGNSQAIGFIHLSSLLNDFEDCLQNIEEKLNNETKEISEQALIRLENLLSDAVLSLEKYFDDLQETSTDQEIFRINHQIKIFALLEWDIQTKIDWGMGEQFINLNTNVTNTDETIQILNTNNIKINEPKIENIKQKNNQNTNELHFLHNDIQKFLLMEQNDKYFAISMFNITEILENRRIYFLPIIRNGLLGAISRFGDIIPIINFFEATSINNSGQNNNDFYSIVICSWLNKKIGIPINSIAQIIDIHKNAVQNVSEMKNITDNMVVNGMTIYQNKTIFLINPEILINIISYKKH